MKRVAIAFGCMFGAGVFLAIICDAPKWATVIGGWVFWVVVRPKERV